MGAVRTVVPIVVAMLAGCIQPRLDVCESLACPTDKQCVVSAGIAMCATTEQLASCADQTDGTLCMTSGACYDRVCNEIVCGNARLEPTEDCDDGNLTSADGCSPSCKLEVCGNGITDPGEGCDCGDAGVMPIPECRGKTNSDADPSAPCRADCTLRTCGDGALEVPEQCEGTDLGGRNCLDFGFYGGELACTGFCTYDTSACTQRCGDGIRQTPYEQCDGADNPETCGSLGYYAGAIGCSEFCTLDTSQCAGTCGDGVLDDGEQCDGTWARYDAIVTTFHARQVCVFYDFHDPMPLSLPGASCTSLCTFDMSGCGGYCGDGSVNGSELCDGTNLDLKSCTDFGLTGNNKLRCWPSCYFDKRECTGCGNGVCNSVGDPQVTGDEDAPESSCGGGGTIACPQDCGQCCPSPPCGIT